MKNHTKRQFLTTAVAGGAVVAGIPLLSCTPGKNASFSSDELKVRYDVLNKVLKQQILKCW